MNTKFKKDVLTLFGKQLNYHRTKRGLSYRKLAQLCDVDHSKISKIEKGKINIQLLTIIELSKGLNVHPRELFDFEFELQNE